MRQYIIYWWYVNYVYMYYLLWLYAKHFNMKTAQHKLSQILEIRSMQYLIHIYKKYFIRYFWKLYFINKLFDVDVLEYMYTKLIVIF